MKKINDYEVFESFGCAENKKGMVRIFEKNGFLIEANKKDVLVAPDGKTFAIKKGKFTKQ